MTGPERSGFQGRQRAALAAFSFSGHFSPATRLPPFSG
jgi:hypothetical protein